MAADRSIQLVNCNKDDKSYTFNKKVLQQIIEENGVQDLPVSVISVAGDVRKGKSFLLNFFLRYLYAKDRKNWLIDSSESLKGFEWRGGHRPHTEGIHIWSKIFKLETADGSQVAVILMDTQGTFGGKSSNKTGTAIFALSALVSSIQIYNLSKQIKENDLENLLWFTEFTSSLKRETEQKTIQSLIFLVRDWQWFEEFSYGEEGGKMLLDGILEVTPDQEPSLTKVRNNIRSTFEKLSCFLLPHPGKTVASKSYNGNIKDIDDEFITHIRDFVSSLLCPKNLVVKNVAGHGNVTGNDLIELFATYLKYSNSDELPEEVSKAESATEAYNGSLLEECVYDHINSLFGVLEEHLSHIEDCTSDVFRDEHERIQTEVIDKFNEATRFNMGNTSSKIDILTLRTQEYFVFRNGQIFEYYNGCAEYRCEKLASEVEKEYNNIMIAVLAKNEDEIEHYTATAYADKHENCKKMGIDKFRKHKRFVEYETTECLEKLKQDIDDSFEVNVSRRKAKFEPAASFNNHFIEECEECFGEYNKRMRELMVVFEFLLDMLSMEEISAFNLDVLNKMQMNKRQKLLDTTQLPKDDLASIHKKHKHVAMNGFRITKSYFEDILPHGDNSFISNEAQQMHIVEHEKEKRKEEFVLNTEGKKHETENGNWKMENVHQMEIKHLELDMQLTFDAAQQHEEELKQDHTVNKNNNRINSNKKEESKIKDVVLKKKQSNKNFGGCLSSGMCSATAASAIVRHTPAQSAVAGTITM